MQRAEWRTSGAGTVSFVITAALQVKSLRVGDLPSPINVALRWHLLVVVAAASLTAY